jgi:hypothetical protein
LIVANFKLIIKRDAELEVGSSGTTQTSDSFNRSRLNFFLVAINDDKSDTNVEMKVVLYEYSMINPFVKQNVPLPKVVASPYTGVNEYNIEFDNPTIDGTNYDQRDFKIKEMECLDKLINKEIFCGFIAKTGEAGYMVLSTNKENEVFVLIKNFFDFKHIAV